MCGIAGSRSRESGFDLYQQNLVRGYYSSSVVCLHKSGYLVIKKEGELKLEDVPVGAEYYLFHSRGPTVETTQFDWDDNHPFSYGRFLVAHNGIIENANDLYGGDIGVDSRVIPWLIDKELRNQTVKDADKAILDALNQLKGTFGLWIYDTTTGDIHIVRNDVTLSSYGTEFGSTNSGYLSDVKQQQIFKFKAKSNIMEPSNELTLTKKPKYFIATPKS